MPSDQNEAVNETRQTEESQEPLRLEDLFGEVIHVVTRADLIADGDLVDVTETAREAGFTIPVALSRSVWEDCVAWTREDSDRQTRQDEPGRLWDVLWMASIAARRNRDGNATSFQLFRVPRGGKGRQPRLVALKMLCGPGDQAEPVITILQPNQD